MISVPGTIGLLGLNESSFTNDVSSAFEDGWEDILQEEMQTSVEVTVVSIVSNNADSTLSAQIDGRGLTDSERALNINFVVKLILNQNSNILVSDVVSIFTNNMRSIIVNETARLGSAISTALQTRTGKMLSMSTLQWLTIVINYDDVIFDTVTTSSYPPSSIPSFRSEHTGEHKNHSANAADNNLIIGVIVGVCLFSLLAVGICVCKVMSRKSGSIALKVSPVAGL